MNGGSGLKGDDMVERRYRVYLNTEDPERKEFFEILLTVKGLGMLKEPVLRANIPEVAIENLRTGTITRGDPKT